MRDFDWLLAFLSEPVKFEVGSHDWLALDEREAVSQLERKEGARYQMPYERMVGIYHLQTIILRSK